MTDAQGAGVDTEEAPPRTRDWVRGLVVVVGAWVLITAVLYWVLVGSQSCGTRPAPGYEDAGAAVCGSLVDPRRVAGDRSGPATLALTAVPARDLPGPGGPCPSLDPW